MAQVHCGDIDNKKAGGNFIDQSVNNKNTSTHIGDRIITYITYKDRSNALKDLLSKTVIAATHDSSERDNASKCHPDTRVAVKEHVMTWAGYGDEGTTAKKRIMWLSGPAGGGKTAIMGTVADELHAMGKLAGSFFFSSFSQIKERGVKKYFIITLVYQLIQHKNFEHFRDAVLSSIEKDPAIFDKHLKVQMKVLILDPLRRCRLQSSAFPDVILLDGLDECGTIVNDQLEVAERLDAQRSREKDQTEILAILLDSVKNSAFPFRILIASRPEPSIKHFFSSCGSFSCNIFLGSDYNPDADIALFLNARFAQIRHRYPTIPSSWPREADIRRLVTNASGQFIYAATIIRFVEAGQRAPIKQLEIVLELRPGEFSNPLELLDTLYARVLMSSPDPILAQLWLIAYIQLGGKNFGPKTAWFWCRLCQSSEEEPNFLLDNLSALICPANLEAPYKASMSFYHKTFQDFLTDEHRYGRHFPSLNNVVAEQWLSKRFDWIFRHKATSVLFSDLHYRDVFNAIVPFYWRRLPAQLRARASFDQHLNSLPFESSSHKLLKPGKGVEGGRLGDIVIIILGESSAGKSSFINRLVGWNQMEVGTRPYSSTTKSIQVAIVQHVPKPYEAFNNLLEGRRIVLIDTPPLGRELTTDIQPWLDATQHVGIMYLRSPYRDRLDDVSIGKYKFHPDGTVELPRDTGAQAQPLSFVMGYNADRATGAQALSCISRGAYVHHLRPHDRGDPYNSTAPSTAEYPIQLSDPWDIIRATVVSMDARGAGHWKFGGESETGRPPGKRPFRQRLREGMQKLFLRDRY